jgi:Glycoside Hydrolase Family 113
MNTTRRTATVLAACLLLGFASGRPLPADKPAPRPRTLPAFQKGVNFTAEGPQSYGSEEAGRMLDQLAAYGVNVVALVPFGFQRFGETHIRFPGGWERDEMITRQAAMAHQRSIRVLLKPQIWIPRKYPGDLDFPSAQERQEWFASYREFILHYADLASSIHAEMFCVGVEFVRLSRYENEWRKIIAEVRRHYSGPLTYAANFGTDFEETRFWDALDFIGLNEYYPLPDDLSTVAVVKKIEQVHRRFHKPVIFTETGFHSRKGTHRAPWDESLPEKSLDEQARCYQAVFEAFYDKPWIKGMYWWKVGTNGFGGPDDLSATPWRKPAMDVVKKFYTSKKR